MEEASASAIVRVVALFYHVGKDGKDYCHKEKMRIPIVSKEGTRQIIFGIK